MSNSKILSSLIALLAFSSLEAQKPNKTPQIVVNIVIDQLRTDYLEAFMPLYGIDGFKRLYKDGRIYTQGNYDIAKLDRASAVASIVSGTYPYDNGIIGEWWLDRKTLRPTFCVNDEKVVGIRTNDHCSPKNLTVSTVSDELKIATGGQAAVYSIAPFKDAAILLGGHAANCALWIDKITGRWCSSSYYSLPVWALGNDGDEKIKEAKENDWEPNSEMVGNFDFFLTGGMKEPFHHKFQKSETFSDFKTSGLVNEQVAYMANKCLLNSSVGSDNITDYLSLLFYAGNYRHQPISTCYMELQDTYVRLDESIGNILNNINNKVGLQNALIVLTSTGYSDQKSLSTEQYHIPSGIFDIERASALMNIYLSAIYGQDAYVEATHDNQIYINHTLLENKHIKLAEILEQCQDFLLQLSGVKEIYTSHRLFNGSWSPEINKIKNSYNAKTSGDISIEVTPGWHLVNKTQNLDKLVRASCIPFPIIFLGDNIEHAIIKSPTKVVYIAPTISKALRIRAPNSCNSAPILEIP